MTVVRCRQQIFLLPARSGPGGSERSEAIFLLQSFLQVV